MVAHQPEEALIPVESRHPRLLQLGMVLHLKHRITLHQLRNMASVHKVDDGLSMQRRRVAPGELLDVVGDLLEGEVGLRRGDLLAWIVVGVVGLFAR